MRVIHGLLVVVLFFSTVAGAQTGPVVRFAGPVNQDGCPYCCEFSCQQTPTPVPEIDGQGRPVFRRSYGQFLLVVEAGLGTSNRQVGSEGVFSNNTIVTITDPSGKPSMMMLAENPLGVGTSQIDCRTLPLGGVPGFPALDFNAGSNVNTALADMACRFEFSQSSQFACTRDRFGNFAFINPATSRQFCFQVGSIAEFPIGRTTVAVQLRDVSGNLGPRYEFVVVVDDSVPPTATPTATRTPAPPTATATRTGTRTNTSTRTATSTATWTRPPTATPVSTATRTATSTGTATWTRTPTVTRTFTRTATATSTGTATSTATPTRTPTPRNPNIAGSIRYYISTRAVPTATVVASGSTSRSVTTSTTGAYSLTEMSPGTLTVEPRKVGDFGSPVAITALDAAQVLQVIAGMRTFDARQRMACDVTGNGSLSSLDAANILQRQVGLLPRFAAATKCDSDWLFEPVATAATGRRLIQPVVNTAGCTRGAIAYEPLSADQSDQDFLAMLIGDCTGNWQPPAGAGLQALAPGAAPDVRLRVSRRTADGMIRVPIAVEAPGDYFAVDLTIDLGPGLRAVAVRPLRAASRALMISNLTNPRRARIALASGEPLQSAAILVLDIAADANAAADVRLLRALIDDEPALATTGQSRVDR